MHRSIAPGELVTRSGKVTESRFRVKPRSLGSFVRGWVTGGTRTRFSELPAQCVDQLHHGHHDDRILGVVKFPAEASHLSRPEHRSNDGESDTTIAHHGAEHCAGWCSAQARRHREEDLCCDGLSGGQVGGCADTKARGRLIAWRVRHQCGMCRRTVRLLLTPRVLQRRDSSATNGMVALRMTLRHVCGRELRRYCWADEAIHSLSNGLHRIG